MKKPFKKLKGFVEYKQGIYNSHKQFKSNIQLSHMDHISYPEENQMSARAIQAWWKGSRVRTELAKLDDSMTFQTLLKCLDHYNTNLQFTEEINATLSKKKIRNENFPSHISENIAKFAIFKKYGIMPCWDTDKGDIVMNKTGLFKQLEIKGFMSSGPASFGPTESWDWIYFVDARDTVNKIFKVYEIRLSNKSCIFRNLNLTKKETYGNIADSKRRPRGCFDTIFKPQLGENCKLIFDGALSELDNTL